MTLSPVDPTNEVAVTSYLSQARDWLSRAVDETGPEQIARAKAEIATAAEATKQLGLSKEIQQDAQEMVRRAEYALAKSIRKGQAEGTVLSDSTKGGRRDVDHPDIARPVTDYATRGELYGSQRATGILSAADAVATDADFDAAVDAARAEGNLSRANVARKARETSGKAAATRRAKPRDTAEVTLNSIQSLVAKAAREAQNLTPDQIRRVKPKADLWTVGLRNSIEALQRLVNSLDPEENQ